MSSLQAEQVQTVAEESRTQGTIKISLYVKYLRAGANIAVLLAVILVNILAQVRKKPGGLYMLAQWENGST